MTQTHMVFVYGSLLRGLGNHGRLLRGRAEFVGRGETKPEFRMVSLGAFPGVLDNGSTAIAGELYCVDDSTLASLDSLEGHPNFYERRQVLIDCFDGKRVAGAVTAWIYILKSRRYGFDENDEIASGNWREYVEKSEDGLEAF